MVAVPKFVEEALEDEDIDGLSARDAFDTILRWNGIIGFTDDILETIEWLNSIQEEDSEIVRHQNENA